MRNVTAFRAWSAAVLASAALLASNAPSAAASDKVGMTAKAYLAECEKAVGHWCSDQIYTVDIHYMLRVMDVKRMTHCLLPQGKMTNAERNAKVVAAVKGWYARHPEALASNEDASVSILKAMDQIWPGPCKR